MDHLPGTGRDGGKDSRQAPVLVIGVGGMLYRAWAELLAAKGIAFVAPTVSELDLTQRESVERGVEERFRLVINCAAWTDVDGAESHVAEAHAVNAVGTAHLAKRCAATGALLVHYSTDYVFDGRGTRPYGVTDVRAPLSVYGHSKALGEEAIEQSGTAHLVIRTSWLYAPWGKNFVRTIAARAKERPLLRVVDDQRGRPTSAEHLARVSQGLLDHGARGIFHVTDGGECTWFELAKETVRLTGGTARVEPCSSAEYPSPVKRPAYSVLDLSATEAILGPMPSWRENLAAAVAKLE